MKEKIKNTKRKQKVLPTMVTISYIIISIVLAVPSVGYLIKNKTVYHFTHVFTYTFTKAQSMWDNYINAEIYLLLFFLLFFAYFYLLKHREEIFNTKKKLFGFILIVGILFSMMIPTTSLDVYSYIGNGWVDSFYQENPYYTSVQEVSNEHGPDMMLGKVARCWRNEPVIYGSVWSLICKGITSISFGNITVALYLFKIATLLVFLACSNLMYKITKKKLFCIMFALNPFILFEFLCNVHNDIFLVFFILLALYWIKNKKNISLAVASIAIATGIKYVSVLLLPFLLIYALRKEELKNKIRKTVFYGIEFIVLLGIFYLFYVRDFKVLSGIFIQQNKYGRSIFLGIYYLLNGDKQALALIKSIALGIFAISYVTIVCKLFLGKQTNKITFRKTIRTYQIFLLIFTFGLITNFNPWYIIWLFPTLIWQKANQIRYTLYLSLGAINSYAITYATKVDDESVGIPYLIVMVLTVAVLEVARQICLKIKEEKKMRS